MAGENRERIQGDTVLPTFSTLKINIILLGRTILRTKETRSRRNRHRIQGSLGRHLPGRIELNSDIQASDVQALGLGRLQETILTCGERPDRKLVLDEFPYIIIHHKRARSESLKTANSCSKLGVNTPLPILEKISSRVQ